jgi:hypothetical protein
MEPDSIPWWSNHRWLWEIRLWFRWAVPFRCHECGKRKRDVMGLHCGKCWHEIQVSEQYDAIYR